MLLRRPLAAGEVASSPTRGLERAEGASEDTEAAGLFCSRQCQRSLDKLAQVAQSKGGLSGLTRTEKVTPPAGLCGR